MPLDDSEEDDALDGRPHAAGAPNYKRKFQIEYDEVQPNKEKCKYRSALLARTFNLPPMAGSELDELLWSEGWFRNWCINQACAFSFRFGFFDDKEPQYIMH